jgi:uncharacterized membrane protein YhaH (DUF805 family)
MVANVLRRFMFGPPLQGMNGYLYIFRRNMLDLSAPAAASSRGSGTLLFTVALVIVVSTALGFMFARVHDGHRHRSVALLTTAVFVAAAVNMGFTLGIQVVITAVFIAGLIVGGRLFSLNDPDGTGRHSIV